jgi:hypothetical protein
MSAEYYDVLILLKDGTWAVRCGPLALSTAKQYALDLVEPPEYAKRNPFPKDRIRIRKHKPEDVGVVIHPERKNYYPKMLADSPEQQREWDRKADEACRPISEVLDVVAEMLEQFNPDASEGLKEEERPF